MSLIPGPHNHPVQWAGQASPSAGDWKEPTEMSTGSVNPREVRVSHTTVPSSQVIFTEHHQFGIPCF